MSNRPIKYLDTPVLSTTVDHNSVRCYTDAETVCVDSEDEYVAVRDTKKETSDQKKLAKAIARRKKMFPEMYAPENKPVVLHDFEELIGSMDAIREAKGRVEITKWNLDPRYACDILSMCFGELIKTSQPPSVKGTAHLKKNANEFAATLAPIISDIRSKGEAKTYQDVADELTRQKVDTFQSKKRGTDPVWYPKTVQNLEDRIACLRETGKLVLKPK